MASLMYRKHERSTEGENEEEEDYLSVGLGENAARYFMYIFNIIFFAFASIMFSACLYVHLYVEMGDYLASLDFQDYYDATTICAVGGLVVMGASCMAWLGTYFWNIPLLVGYVIFTILGFIINLSGAVYLLLVGLEATYAYTFILVTFRDLIWQYNYSISAKVKVNIIQEYIGCCGAASASDWTDIHMPVPNTCRDQITGNQYPNSCAEMLSRKLERTTGIISGIAIWICFLQIFTIIFFLCMYKGMMDRRKALKEQMNS